jgi:uncharacterized membrane protein YhaH (DUF805 family)
MRTYIEAFRNFAELDGRTSRADFWGFAVWNTIFGVLATVADGFLFPHFHTGRGPVTFAYMAAVASPSWCVMVRRLHDKGISGWWSLLNALPVIGQFIVFLMLIQAGDVGENEYGPQPGRELPGASRAERIG